jgi:hypothetical protein
MDNATPVTPLEAMRRQMTALNAALMTVADPRQRVEPTQDDAQLDCLVAIGRMAEILKGQRSAHRIKPVGAAPVEQLAMLGVLAAIRADRKSLWKAFERVAGLAFRAEE